MKSGSHLELRFMNTCSFQTALEIWNEGFQGYSVDMTLTLDKFLARISSQGISPEHSFIAFIEGKPVGFLLNGIRNNSHGRFAWNGGTAVVPAFRGKKVGSSLVNAALDLYKQESVNVAMLEAISDNQPAVSLYQKCGYGIVDELTFLQSDGPIENFELIGSYLRQTVAPAAVSSLSFYREESPWQGQWQTLALSHGEAVILSEANTPVGYALFKKKFDDSGNLSRIELYQCEVAPIRNDIEQIAAQLLQYVFLHEEGEYRRTTYNFRKSNQVVMALLTKAGFRTSIEQVFMTKNMYAYQEHKNPAG
jgi:ribosomal protein S18 acetylase RimI-like enzyme